MQNVRIAVSSKLVCGLAFCLGFAAVLSGCRDGHFEKQANAALIPLELSLESATSLPCAEQTNSEAECFELAATLKANRAPSSPLSLTSDQLKFENFRVAAEGALWKLSVRALLPLSLRGGQTTAFLNERESPTHTMVFELENRAAPIAALSKFVNQGNPQILSPKFSHGKFISAYTVSSKPLQPNEVLATVRFEAELPARFYSLNPKARWTLEGSEVVGVKAPFVDETGYLTFDLNVIREPFASEEDFILETCFDFSFDEICATSILNFERDPLRPLISSSPFQSTKAKRASWSFERFSSSQLQPLLLDEHAIELRSDGMFWKSKWSVARDTRLGLKTQALTGIELDAKVYILDSADGILAEDRVRLLTSEFGSRTPLFANNKSVSTLWPRMTQLVIAVKTSDIEKAKEWNLFCSSSHLQNPLSCSWEELSLLIQEKIRSSEVGAP